MATDDFNRADSGSIGSNWTHIDNGLTIASNKARGATLNVIHREIWATSIGTDVSVEAVVSSFASGGNYRDARVIARHSGSSGSSFYELRFNNAGAYFLVRNVGGGETTLSNSSGAAISVPETFRLEVEGTGATVTLRVYRGGSLQATASDTSGSRLTTGNHGGIASYSEAASIEFDEFTIASLGGGGGATATPAAIAATTTVPKPAIPATVLPITVAGVAATPAPTARGGATRAPAAIGASAAIPAPTARAGATRSPAAIAAGAAAPAPAVSVGAAPATVAAVVAAPASAARGGATVAPTAVVVVVAVPAPTAGQTGGGSATATPSAVVALAVAVPGPLAGGSAIRSPGAVAVLVSPRAPVVSVGARPAVLALAVLVRAPNMGGLLAWSWYLRRAGAWLPATARLGGVHPTSVDVT